MEKRGKKYSSGGRGKAATKQQQRNRSQAVSTDSALLAEPCGGPADEQAKQCRDHRAAAQNAAPGTPLNFDLPIVGGTPNQIQIRWDSSTTFPARHVHGTIASMKTAVAKIAVVAEKK